MAEDLRRATKICSDDDEVRCVVLRGSENVFSEGLDLDKLEGTDTDDMRYRVLANRTNIAVTELAQMSKPTVAAVNGNADNAGFGVAIACDLVLVDEAATFHFAYPEMGLAGDCGVTYFLPHLVGRRRAREIIMLHEPIDAAEAVDIGLATEAVPSDTFDDRVEELADQLAAEPTRALGEAKKLLNNCYDRLLPDHLENEELAIQDMVDTEDFSRGLEAARSDEEPEFEGR
jgi:2-(1,2-epoxy-1,2-dihydrophenyl)acetyl-CoA isomerase